MTELNRYPFGMNKGSVTGGIGGKKTRYSSGVTEEQKENIALGFKESWDQIKDAKLTTEAQAQQDELLRNPLKGALNTFMDLPKQQEQKEQQAGEWLHSKTGGRAPKWAGSLMFGMLDPLTPPGGVSAPISAVKNTLRLNKVSGIAKNALDPFRQRNLKARQERGWLDETNINAKVTNPSWPLSKNDLVEMEELVSDWSREQADILRKTGMSEAEIAKTIKSRITKEWTNPGIELDGEAFRLGQGNINEVLQPGSTSRLKLKSKTALNARALGSDPTQNPAVQQYFKRAHKQGALDPDFTLEEYGKYSSTGAAWSDRMTVDMAKLFGGSKAKQTAISDWTMKSGALDKEHAWSIALKGSNDFLSQFYGSRMLNRSQGKLNSFTREVMNILGAPSNDLESATNWAANQMARRHGGKLTSTWNQNPYKDLAEDLMPSDWLRIQDAFARVPPGASEHIQEEVAMKVLRGRQIITAWNKSDLPKRPKDIKVLQAYMEKIWEIDVPKSKLILDRTIGEQAFKKVMKEMYRITPYKGVKNMGRRVIKEPPAHTSYSIAKPGAKFDPEMGRKKSTRVERGTKVPDKRKFIDLGRDELKILKRDEAAQRYEYIKSTLDRLDEMDTTSNPFGLSEMQDRI